ncbi:hypothetical protein [Pedobacter xixiisoli]|uniref:Uncharacterized protein n=1 Tax=Pedobacter xixiisoli TaxID=1476464 RepID=A0A285ZWH3_9SPHI|nr:hypothetical protein [Pedobacter xixiisoli]SOD13986.1 hypothetical protein SAMN06297358_1345 [Pedobacter xixiisoli]
MENHDKRQAEQKIHHPEKLNVDRQDAAPTNKGAHGEEKEVEYTKDEMEFADGKGTKLADAFDQDQQETQKDDDHPEE